MITTKKKASPLEKILKKKVKEELEAIDGCWFFIKEALSIRGIPDVVGVCRGRFFAWELKRSSSEAAKCTGRIALQRYVLSKINKAGGLGRLVHPDNLEQCLQELRQLPHHTPLDTSDN